MTDFAKAPRQSGPSLALLFLSLLLLLAAVGLTSLGSQYPLVMLVAAGGIGTAAAVALRPELATAVVLFLLYANVAVIAVKFHGVPSMFAFAVPMLLVIPAARNVFGEGRGLLLPPALPWIGAFIAVQLLGAIYAPRGDVAMAKVQDSIFEGAALFVLIVNSLRTAENLQRAVVALVAAGAFMGGIVTYQQLTNSYDNEFGGFGQVTQALYNSDKEAPDDEGQPRLAGPIGEKNRFGQVMGMLVPIALFQMLAATTLGGRLFNGAALAVSLIAIAATLSRGAAVGLGAVLVLAMFTGQIRLRHFAALIPAVVIAALVVPEYGMRLGTLRGSTAMIDDKPKHEPQPKADGAMQGRATEMVAGALMFGDRPILGVGPGMYEYRYREYAKRAGGRVQHGRRRAHSLFLGMAAENGLLGLISFGAILFVTLRDLRRARRYWLPRDPRMTALVTGLGGALLVYLTTSLFLHMGYVRYFWLILAMAAASTCITSAGTRQFAPPRARS